MGLFPPCADGMPLRSCRFVQQVQNTLPDFRNRDLNLLPGKFHAVAGARTPAAAAATRDEEGRVTEPRLVCPFALALYSNGVSSTAELLLKGAARVAIRPSIFEGLATFPPQTVNPWVAGSNPAREPFTA